MDTHHLKIAIAAARAGAHELMSRYDSRVVREKAPRDLVTDADIASQKAIRDILEQSFPGYAFVGEEEGETSPLDSVRRGDTDAPPCWVVDPLDGTINYVHRLDGFAVSIGLYAAGKMRLGVIFDPCRNELFTAIDRAGAFVNEKPLETSRCGLIAESLVACSFPAGVRKDSVEVTHFVRALESCRSIRRLGSCALNMCYVADGRLDGYWASSVSPWDCAAGTVIAREAGATLTGMDGGAYDDWQPRFCVSASETLHQQLLRCLA